MRTEHEIRQTDTLLNAISRKVFVIKGKDTYGDFFLWGDIISDETTRTVRQAV